jgi:osomolarity two-component system sensor histidine kinase NIK1
MCSSMTDQLQSIANVTTTFAKGDLTQKIEIEVEGEMSTLKRCQLHGGPVECIRQ